MPELVGVRRYFGVSVNAPPRPFAFAAFSPQRGMKTRSRFGLMIDDVAGEKEARACSGAFTPERECGPDACHG